VPYVNVRITDEGVTPAQKAAVIAGVTGVLVDVLGKDPATTHVVIDEVPLANWGVAGVPTAEHRAGVRAPAGG
jgi:4-oxalocrotonate tautomerase